MVLEMKKGQNKEAALAELLTRPEVVSWRALMSAYKSILSLLEEGLVQDSCSLPRFEILLFLYFNGKLLPVEIAKKMSVTRGNISMFIKRMEADNLVEKIYLDDRARPFYGLTKDGRILFEKIFPSHVDKISKNMPTLSTKSLKSLNRMRGKDIDI